MFIKNKLPIISACCALILSGCMGPSKKDYLKKQTQLDQRLQVLEPTLENNHERYAALVELGDVSACLNDYVRGKEAYLEAIEITKNSPQDDTNRRKRARLLRDLADLYFVSHDEKTALEYYTQSLNLYREIEGVNSNSFEVCLGLLNIGNSHFALGNKDESQEFLTEFMQRRDRQEASPLQ